MSKRRASPKPKDDLYLTNVGRGNKVRKKRDRCDRAFLIGLIWAAWWLSKGHGEDTYAMDLLREAVTDLEYVRRLAQKEQYHFRRGFWPELMEKRRRARRLL